MAEFTPVKMTRKRDGAERTATTQAEQVAAEFDGFAVSAGSRAAATRRANKTTAKKAAKTTDGASKTAAAGGPVAKTAATAPKAPAAPAVATAK